MFFARVSPQWHDLTDTAPLQQHWAYGLAMERLGVRVLRQVQNGVPVQMLERWGLRLLHQPAAGVNLRPLARHPGLTLCSTPWPQRGLLPLISERFHAHWNIALTPDQLRRAMRPTWRHQLDRATAKPVPDPKAAAEILARAGAQGRARGYRNLPPAFALNWPAGIYALRVGVPMIAGAVFLIHGPRASYFAAWADETGKGQGAHRAILWQAAIDLGARGVREIDLGAFDAGNEGLARFKLGTGAQPFSHGPTSLVLPL